MFLCQNEGLECPCYFPGITIQIESHVVLNFLQVNHKGSEKPLEQTFAKMVSSLGSGMIRYLMGVCCRSFQGTYILMYMNIKNMLLSFNSHLKKMCVGACGVPMDSGRKQASPDAGY